jgi:hypothetical protein
VGGETLAGKGPIGREFREVFVHSLRDAEDLRTLFQDHLNMNLWTITEPKGLGMMVFDAICWAESRGKLEALLCAARQHNPDNLDLFKFAARFGPRRQLA